MAAAAEAVPGLATPEGQASHMGSVGRDSAPSQLNRVRFKDEEEQSQNKSSASSVVADVQGDVAILDETTSSKASASRGPAEASKPASKTASSNAIGSK